MIPIEPCDNPWRTLMETLAMHCSIQDDIWISVNPPRVYRALIEAEELGHWWPKSAISEPRVGGRLVFTWFSGDTLETKFERLVEAKEVVFPFHSEKLAFTLSEENGGTRLRIHHQCGGDDSIHVAQAWGFLKANLKAYLEHGLDLRDPV